ncbi:MAG TPA: hypothetical protein V6D00_01625 [Pantanalinema sp.]
MSSLIESIAPEFLLIAKERNFSIKESSVDTKLFGNSLILLNSPEFNLRIIKDRGQIFVEIGKSENEWHNLDYILEFVDSSYIPETDDSKNVNNLAKYLNKNWEPVRKLMTGDLFKSGYISFEESKSLDLVSKIFKNKDN